jgi:hypothetical protein
MLNALLKSAAVGSRRERRARQWKDWKPSGHPFGA